MAAGEILGLTIQQFEASETDMIRRALDGQIAGALTLSNTTECTMGTDRSPVMYGDNSEMLHPSELEENWQDDANCLGVDPDLFFPERGASTREAKEVCRGCAVRSDCLEFALQNGEKFGIWGGMSERERRRMRRQRAQAAKTIIGS